MTVVVPVVLVLATFGMWFDAGANMPATLLAAHALVLGFAIGWRVEAAATDARAALAKPHTEKP